MKLFFEGLGLYILVGNVVTITTLLMQRKKMKSAADEIIAVSGDDMIIKLDKSSSHHRVLRIGLWVGASFAMMIQWPYIVYLTVVNAFKKEKDEKGKDDV